MMKELYEGMNICVSVKALYDMEKDLLLGHIVPDFEDNEMVYYDLYNEYGELCVNHRRSQSCVLRLNENTYITQEGKTNP